MLTPSIHSPRHRVAPLTLLAFLPLFAACGAGSATGSDGAVVLTLVPAAAEVATHQVTTAIVRGVRLTAQSYSGTLGAASITAGRANDSTLAFAVPALPAGEHRISLTIGGPVATAMVRVAVTPDITDPVAYVNDVAALFIARIESTQQAVTRAAGRAIPVDQAGFASDIAKAQAAIDSARIAFAAMTPAEQQEAAKLVRATFGSGASGSLLRQAPSAASVVPGPEYCEAPLLLTDEQTEVCSAAARQELATTEVSDCEAEAAEAASRGFSARNRNFLWQLFNGCHYASVAKFSADTWEAVQWPTMPDLDEAFAELRSPAAAWGPVASAVSTTAAQTAPIGFFPGSPREIEPTVRFRPMLASDIGKVPAATQTGLLLAGLLAKWNQLNSYLGGFLGQAPATLERVTSATPQVRRYATSRLRLGAVSPATVRGSAAITNGKWALTFDTDDRTQPTPFTFDVIYDAGTYGSDTARVSGVTVLDSMALYRAEVAGLWTVTDALTNISYPVELRADGTAFESGRTAGGWSIEKGPYPYYYPESRYYVRLWRPSLTAGGAAELVIGALSMPVTEFRSHMNNGNSPHRYVKN